MGIIKYIVVGLGFIVLLAFLALEIMGRRAETQRHWGFVNDTGELVIPMIYDDVREFSMGYAAVKRGNDWGFIDESGTEVIPSQFLRVGDFSRSNNAWAMTDDFRVGYIGYDGTWVIEPRFHNVRWFSEERAIAGIAVGRTTTHISGSSGQSIYSFGLINEEGLWIVPPKEDEDDPERWSDGREFSEDLCAVQIDGKRWGYIDRSGTFVIPPIYDNADSFQDGVALVDLREGGHEIIDRNGTTLASIPVSMVFQGESGYFTVFGELDGKEGAFVADREGYMVIGPYESAKEYGWTRLPVQRDDGKWIMIDLEGNQYGDAWDDIETPSVGWAAVRRDSKEGFMDHRGNVVVPPIYDRVGYFQGGFAGVAERVK